MNAMSGGTGTAPPGLQGRAGKGGGPGHDGVFCRPEKLSNLATVAQETDEQARVRTQGSGLCLPAQPHCHQPSL